MPTPMSAARIAAASLAPSPTMPTTRPASRSDSTTWSFCSGATRATTSASRSIRERAVRSAAASSSPVTTTASSGQPRSTAMAWAVCGWSPVSTTGRTPASRSPRTRAGEVSRATSASASSPVNSSPEGCRSRTSAASSPCARVRRATAMMRSPARARRCATSAVSWGRSAQAGSTVSGAPLTTSTAGPLPPSRPTAAA